MKRFVISAVLFASACTSSVHPVDTAGESPILELDEPAPPPPPAKKVAPAAVQHDEVADQIPTGTFVDIKSFCAAQMTLIAPRIAEANLRAKEYGGEATIVAACRELPEALANATMALEPAVAVKSVMVQTGGATAVFLLVNASAGWSAIRTPFLSAYDNDPGCGSIERMDAIKDIHIDAGALVVTTQSGRTYWRTDDDYGELTLTHARACHAGEACAQAEVVDAKAVTHLDSEAPTRVRLFNTSYVVETSGAIIPATMFDEAKL